MNNHEMVKNNLKIYNAIKPKNPSNSYTVLATINDHVSGELLALATGTQACLRIYPDDIQDCHAESLVKRAFKRYLINQTRNILESSAGVFDRKKLIRETCEKDLVLFITQFPCGLIRRFKGEEPVDETTGRIIRRKPGRGVVVDGKCVYVEKDDCLTKIRRWLHTGLQGKNLGKLLNINCRIKTLLIGNCEAEANFDYNVHVDQLRQTLSKDNSVYVEVLSTVRKDEFLCSTHKQPQSVMLVSWNSSNLISDKKTIMKSELLVDGRKRGVTRKQFLMETSDSHRLLVGKHTMKSDVNLIETYLENLGADKDREDTSDVVEKLNKNVHIGGC